MSRNPSRSELKKLRAVVGKKGDGGADLKLDVYSNWFRSKNENEAPLSARERGDETHEKWKLGSSKKETLSAITIGKPLTTEHEEKAKMKKFVSFHLLLRDSLIILSFSSLYLRVAHIESDMSELSSPTLSQLPDPQRGGHAESFRHFRKGRTFEERRNNVRNYFDTQSLQTKIIDFVFA